VLAVPGHAASDPAGARTLLGEALATPETLLPSERALADLMIRDLDARLALVRENEALRGIGPTNKDDERLAELDRRLQAEIAEKEQLRRELERAEAKLEAIATLEGGKAPPRR
jgi:serine phosphatase RsbU (regulator of sigma subunit)